MDIYLNLSLSQADIIYNVQCYDYFAFFNRVNTMKPVCKCDSLALFSLSLSPQDAGT